MKKIVIDLDGTLTHDTNTDYENKPVNEAVVRQCRELKAQGYQIVVFTARNMRTFNGEIGKINIHTLPQIISWLQKNNVPFDEVLVGKPWCGHEGFYVDDKAIRPSEFASLKLEEIKEILAKENPYTDGGNK